MKDKFGINIPDQLLNDMEKASASEDAMMKIGVEWAANFVTQVKSLGVKGIHFFIMGNPQPAILVKENDEI
jgi:methylenetetrahydrofolate reductase (NADPH)